MNTQDNMLKVERRLLQLHHAFRRLARRSHDEHVGRRGGQHRRRAARRSSSSPSSAPTSGTAADSGRTATRLSTPTTSINNQVGLPRDIVQAEPVRRPHRRSDQEEQAVLLRQRGGLPLPRHQPLQRNVSHAFRDQRHLHLCRYRRRASQREPAASRAGRQRQSACRRAAYSDHAGSDAGQDLWAGSAAGRQRDRQKRITANGDYNTEPPATSRPALDSRNFYHHPHRLQRRPEAHLSLVYNFDGYKSIPDFLNNIVPIFPGAGTVLFSNVSTGQRSNRFDGTLSLRSALEFAADQRTARGFNGGTVLFFDAGFARHVRSLARLSIRRFAASGPDSSTVTTTTAPQRRNAPVKNFGDTVSWVKGSHQFSFGGSFDQINVFQQISATGVIPRITIGIASRRSHLHRCHQHLHHWRTSPGRPAPRSSARLLQLYADVTGRVSSTTVTQALSESTKTVREYRQRSIATGFANSAFSFRTSGVSPRT